MRRFIVERISDGKLLELELPLTDVKSGPSLMEAGTLSGKLDPVVGKLLDENGQPMIDPGATFISEEIDGVIRGTYFVSHSQASGESWKVEGQGFVSALQGQPYEGEYRGVKVDPADVAREVVAHLQRFGSSEFGIRVVGKTSTIVGTDSDLKYDAAKADHDVKKKALKVAADKRKAKLAQVKKAALPFDKAIKQLKDQAKPIRAAYQSLIDARKPLMDAYTVLTKQRKARTDVYDAAVKAKRPAGEIAAAKAAVDALKTPIANAKALVDAKRPAIDAAKVPLDAKNSQIRLKQAERAVAIEDLQAEYEALKLVEEPLKKPVADAKEVLDKAKAQVDADGGAWKILWWDTPDSFDAFCDAVAAAGYEWFEWSGWNADRTKILKELRIVKRVGRRQTGLKFIEGDNIVEAVTVEDSLSEYANTIVALGAGEGRAALRVTVGATDSRRRRIAVLDAKHITTKAALERAARAELKRRMQRFRIDGIKVETDHGFARQGTYGVGDDILVECDVSVHGRVAVWRRIRSIDIGDGELGIELGDVA